MIDSVISERRHEIKLAVDHRDLATISMWLRLHPANFSTQHPQRKVNNIYFDTPDLSSVEDNLAGFSQRRKLRFRWYGTTNDISHGTWEIKAKQVNLGWKISQPVNQCVSLSEMRWAEIIARLRSDASDSISTQLNHSSCPALINHYQRLYYVSWNGSIRATVDFDQAFYDQRLSGAPNLTRPLPGQERIIIELKAAPSCHDQLVEIVKHLPVRVSKNSKYVSGMLRANEY